MKLYKLEYDKEQISTGGVRNTSWNHFYMILECKENQYKILIAKKNGTEQVLDACMQYYTIKDLKMLMGETEQFKNIEFEPCSYEEYLLACI